MNRALHYFNLFGVAVLAVVCVMQWRINRELNLRTVQLEKEGLADRARIEDQDRQLKGHAADLDSFREHVQRARTELQTAESNLVMSRRELERASSEREGLKQSIASWSKAVAERDEQIKHASDLLQKLGTERNEVVGKFNDLAKKHNRVVEVLNERTREYNAVVDRFNALAKAGNANSR